MEQNHNAMYAHALNCVRGMSALRLEKLYHAFSSLEEAWRQPAGALCDVLEDVTCKDSLEQRACVNPQEEWEKLRERGIAAVSLDNPQYPLLLKEIPHPPVLLYFRSAQEHPFSSDIKTAAIVGTRRATPYGKAAARQIAERLARHGVVVISGLAIGIDAEAHDATLESGTPTWAVLGSGLNRIYPPRNQPLAKRILENGGALISEYHPDTEAAPYTFPQRNRIVAGLARATIVIEAPERSGALITARLALETNRDVAAVPGDIFSENAKGANALLRQGAALIRNGDDALELLGIRAASQPITLDKLDEVEQHILRCLRMPSSGEEIVQSSGLAPRIVQQKLSLLELRGIIRQTGDKFITISS